MTAAVQGPVAMAPFVGSWGAAERLPQVPPTACLLCQARRTPCDETKPGCRRCEKLRINCPGYREAASQKKRKGPPQKAAVRRQVHDRDTKRTKPVPFVGRSWMTYTEKLESRWRDLPACPDDAFEDDGNFTVMVPTPFGRIPARVEVPIEDQAQAFFLDSYVRAPTRPGERGSNWFILSMLSHGGLEACFDHAFRAASLAALSTRPSFRRLRAKAQVEYVHAIRAVGDAVQGLARGEGSKTQTLASVLLMAIYETLACPSQQIDAFEAHVRGAVQLVSLLGVENLQSEECKEMLVLARSRMLTIKVLPGRETSFTDTLEQSLMPVGYRDMLGKLGLWMASLAWQRGHMVQAMEDGKHSPEVVAKLCKLKKGCQEIAETLLDAADSLEHGESIPNILARQGPFPSVAPESDRVQPPQSDEGATARHNTSPALWPRSPPVKTPSTSPASRQTPPDTPGSEAAVQMLDFADHKEASFYSTCMAGCLLVSHSIVRCVAWLSFVEGGDSSAYESDPEYLWAAELARRAVSGLVRCIRYYKTALVRPTTPSVPPTRSDDVTDFTMISCVSVLYAALVSQFCTEPQRRLLRAALESIGDEGGIGQVCALLRVSRVTPRYRVEYS
ncbi:hypothetical protein MAPG_04823 [Magnaporthiopsis poae ATCC 64411]|uniref:Zn(2)-C6 fungal-type domain-containing protein n=1 Tax=Magnaporthiopsis poae (strain ATCC 64411 / 73-15) TaxID=644358 RepID=A0A0C4DXR6_MAGP6|nr:hypothetical protein MAPG_04823 [Magnaporthiopsis poae ATCC 64411]